MKIYQPKKIEYLDKNRYRELVYFCRQYDSKKQRLKEAGDMGSPELSDMPKSKTNKTSDRVAREAVRLAEARADVELIEKTAAAVCKRIEKNKQKETARALIDYICREQSFSTVNPPVNKKIFFGVKQAFFARLDEVKK